VAGESELVVGVTGQVVVVVVIGQVVGESELVVGVTGQVVVESELVVVESELVKGLRAQVVGMMMESEGL
jgi:hypothetical protein